MRFAYYFIILYRVALKKLLVEIMLKYIFLQFVCDRNSCGRTRYSVAGLVGGKGRGVILPLYM